MLIILNVGAFMHIIRLFVVVIFSMLLGTHVNAMQTMTVITMPSKEKLIDIFEYYGLNDFIENTNVIKDLLAKQQATILDIDTACTDASNLYLSRLLQGTMTQSEENIKTLTITKALVDEAILEILKEVPNAQAKLSLLRETISNHVSYLSNDEFISHNFSDLKQKNYASSEELYAAYVQRIKEISSLQDRLKFEADVQNLKI